MKSLIELLSRVIDGETKTANTIRMGKVTHVDPAKKRMRMRIGGTDEKPYLSPWVPYSQTAGALKIHSPPSVGQQMVLASDGGDFRQSVAVPFGWGDDNPSPSDKGDEHVMTFGSIKAAVRDKQVIFEVGGAKVDVTDETITATLGGRSITITAGGGSLG